MSDTELLDWLLAAPLLTVTLPVEDGSVGADYVLRTRADIVAQMVRCNEYDMRPVSTEDLE